MLLKMNIAKYLIYFGIQEDKLFSSFNTPAYYRVAFFKMAVLIDFPL